MDIQEKGNFYLSVCLFLHQHGSSGLVVKGHRLKIQIFGLRSWKGRKGGVQLYVYTLQDLWRQHWEQNLPSPLVGTAFLM